MNNSNLSSNLSKNRKSLKRRTTRFGSSIFKNGMTKSNENSKTPDTIHSLLVGKMIKAEQEYYLQNTDVGMMLGIYI